MMKRVRSIAKRITRTTSEIIAGAAMGAALNPLCASLYRRGIMEIITEIDTRGHARATILFHLHEIWDAWDDEGGGGGGEEDMDPDIYEEWKRRQTASEPSLTWN